MEYLRLEKNFEEESIPLVSTESEFEGLKTGIGGVSKEEQDFLSNIISNLNESFGIDFSDDDKVNLRRMFSIYKDNEEYKNIHEGDNTYSNKKSFSDKLFDDLSQELVDRDLEFYKKIQKPEVNNFLKRIFYERYEEQLT